MAILLNLVKFAIVDLINGVTGISGIAAGYIIVLVSFFHRRHNNTCTWSL